MSNMHPIQIPHQWRAYTSEKPRVTTTITLRAYEVYSHVYGEQRALVEGECRGGFSVCELIAFLYAYPFPCEQWQTRVNEAFAGMSWTGDYKNKQEREQS